MPLSPVNFYEPSADVNRTISKNSFVTLDVGASTRAIIVTIGASDARCSMVMVSTSSAGVTNLIPVKTGSDVVYDTTTNYKIKVTNNNANATTLYAFNLSEDGGIS